jgi:hypothetical protein
LTCPTNIGRASRKFRRSQTPDMELKKPNRSLMLEKLVTFSNEEFYGML